MTPTQRALIKQFIEHQEMAEAVRFVLMERVAGTSLQKEVLDGAELMLDDQVYGQIIRARANGVRMLLDGFAQLKLIANGKEGVQSPQNQAR